MGVEFIGAKHRCSARRRTSFERVRRKWRRDAKFAPSAHVSYIVRVSQDADSYEYAVSEHLRMSGVYWACTGLDLIEQTRRSAYKDAIISLRARVPARMRRLWRQRRPRSAHFIHALGRPAARALRRAREDRRGKVMGYVAGLQLPGRLV